VGFSEGSRPYNWIYKDDYREGIYSTATSSTIVIISNGTGYRIRTFFYDE
jgi:hypothetical protein